MRMAIRQAAPGAEEVISYNMPMFRLHGRLVYYCAHSQHIGFYPFTSAIRAFRSRLSGYKTSTGTVQFPFDKKIPVSLVKAMVKFRVKENFEKVLMKKRKKMKRHQP